MLMISRTSPALIKTKFLPPVFSNAMVVRQRLIDILQSGLSRKLILVSAPAGFGKTTILGQWLKLMKAEKVRVSWISLDSNDNDPETFLRYVIAALREIDEKIGRDAMQSIDSAPNPDISDSLGSLVNDLVAVDEEVFLFLDDFHLISASEINQFVELLLNLSPPNFHLVISARTLTDLPLANMKVQDDLLQVSAEKLRFNAEESERFLLQSRGLRLSESLLRTLNERCEGWVAGLQLASLSLKEADSQDAFIQRFSGNIKDVADYLAVAVLDQQAEPVRNFLFGTAILDRLNADLCNSLLGCDNAHELLQRLEFDNLFIVPLDQERTWYRYHPLFQEFLLARLEKKQKARIKELNDKASLWFRRQGHLDEAVDYALRAGNMQAAAELIENRAIAEFMNGRMPRVAAWVNRIPQELRLQHPHLMLLQGTALYHMNQADEAARICDLLEQRIGEIAAQGGMDANEISELRNEWHLIKT